jgi:hypothetical protein
MYPAKPGTKAIATRTRQYYQHWPPWPSTDDDNEVATEANTDMNLRPLGAASALWRPPCLSRWRVDVVSSTAAAAQH